MLQKDNDINVQMSFHAFFLSIFILRYDQIDRLINVLVLNSVYELTKCSEWFTGLKLS